MQGMEQTESELAGRENIPLNQMRDRGQSITSEDDIHRDDFFYVFEDPDTRELKKARSYVQKIQFSLDAFSEPKALPSKYLRVSSSISDATLKRSILQLYDEHEPPDEKDLYAKVVLPEIAITFIGGCEEQLLTEKLRESLTSFTAGILGKFNCLLITRGSHVGVTKLIGKVCSTETSEWNYGQASKTIGILPWSCVRDKECLLINEGDDIIVDYKPKISKSRLELHNIVDWPLDPNQQLYFLIDEGTGAGSGMETECVIKLNMMLRRVLEVPCIMILTGGGKRSLEAMYKFLFPQQEENMAVTADVNVAPYTDANVVPNRPVVIVMNGSGKLADLLSAIVAIYQKGATDGDDTNNQDYFEKAFEKAKDEYEKNLEKDEFSRKLFNKLTEEIIANNEHKEMLIDCITKKREQILIYELEDKNDAESDLEAVLFRALKVAEPIGELKLLFAIQSNDKSLARNLMDKEPELGCRRAMKILRETSKESAFDVMTSLILKSNKLPWIKILLEVYEFEIEKYTKDHLWELFNLRRLENNRIAVSGVDLHKLIEFYYKKEYKRNEVEDGDKEMVIWDVGKVIEDLAEENTVGNIHEIMLINTNTDVINPIQALLINSILFLDLNAAKLFWYFDQYNPLSNALLAYVLLSGLRNNAIKVYASAPYDFEEALQYFESLVGKLIDAYFKVNKEMAEKAIANRLELWKFKPLFHVAGEVELKSVFGKEACKMFVRENWGKIPDENSWSQDNASAKEKKAKCFCLQSRISLSWKMLLHLAVHILFVLCFAIFVVFTKTVLHEPVKWITTVVVIAQALEELRQFKDIGKSWHRSIEQYLFSIWNLLDVFAIVTFFVGLLSSYIGRQSSKVNIGFISFVVSSFLRILQFLGMIPALGLYVVMIRKMMVRMQMFVLVLLLSIVAYGILMTALLHPSLRLDWDILLRVFFRPSFAVFGEPGIESFELNNSTTVFGTKKVGVASEIIVIVGMAVFMLFANILLVNLLIADFSHIHGKILERSGEIYCFVQYEIQEEFRKKPSIPIPFSIFQNVYSLLPNCCPGKEERQQKRTSNEMLQTKRIAEFERFCFRKLFPKIPDDVVHPAIVKDYD